jgi:hypothetical protein
MSPLQGEDVLFVRDPRVAREARLPWAILCHAVGVEDQRRQRREMQKLGPTTQVRAAGIYLKR